MLNQSVTSNNLKILSGYLAALYQQVRLYILCTGFEYTESIAMTRISLPLRIYSSRKQRDDYSASDMRCGDLTHHQLVRDYHLSQVSGRVDPYTLSRISAFNQPQSMFHGSHRQGKSVNRQQCVEILFDEFRHLSAAFACYGPYKFVIEEMITHMQCSNGAVFHSAGLDRALKQQILRDRSEKNSTRYILTRGLSKFINWQSKSLDTNGCQSISEEINKGKLPKFDRFRDSFNGLGISVHDTWSTDIAVTSLSVEDNHYHACIRYRVQDHFGLDDNDILSSKFSQFRLFRIWFLLQRSENFAFRPFMSNMDATIGITGGRQ